LLIDVIPPYSIPEATFDLEIYYESPSINVEIIENIEPYEIKDRFDGDKYGIIFKELIYVR